MSKRAADRSKSGPGRASNFGRGQSIPFHDVTFTTRILRAPRASERGHAHTWNEKQCVSENLKIILKIADGLKGTLPFTTIMSFPVPRSILGHRAGLIQRLWEERLLHGGTKGMGWEGDEKEEEEGKARGLVR